MTLEERLLKRVIKTDDGHWLFPALPNQHGQIRVDGKTIEAHRIAAMLWLNYDLNDEKHIICHIRSCEYKNCINPEHLYIGDHGSNIIDAARVRQVKNPLCPKGHEYTRGRFGWRICKICQAEWNKNYGKDHKEHHKEYMRKWREKQRNANSN